MCGSKRTENYRLISVSPAGIRTFICKSRNLVLRLMERIAFRTRLPPNVSVCTTASLENFPSNLTHLQDIWPVFWRYQVRNLDGASTTQTMHLASPGSVRGPGRSVGIATDYGLDGPGSNPGGYEIFRLSQTGPGACKMGTGSFPGVKCGRGVLLTTHPLLVPRSWKSRVIPLPTLWATPGL